MSVVTTSAIFLGPVFAIAVFFAVTFLGVIIKMISNMGAQRVPESDEGGPRDFNHTQEVTDRAMKGFGVILLLVIGTYFVIANSGMGADSTQQMNNGITAAGFVLTLFGGIFFLGIKEGYATAKNNEAHKKPNKKH